MLIVGGVNFFPSQVEGILLGFQELTSHYVIRLASEERRDRVTVDVEVEPSFWSEQTPQRMEETKRKVESRLKNLVGFGMEVRPLEPFTLTRSEGKSKRVVDER
jgi:phenylacetate-CoA ligase